MNARDQEFLTRCLHVGRGLSDKAHSAAEARVFRFAGNNTRNYFPEQAERLLRVSKEWFEGNPTEVELQVNCMSTFRDALLREFRDGKGPIIHNSTNLPVH